MAGKQDWAIRLAEILDIPQAEALELTRRLIPVLMIESIVGVPTTRVAGLVGAPSIGTIEQGPVAAQFPHVQIFNPANSGVTVFLDSIILSTAVATRIQIRQFDTALPTLGTAKGYQDFRRTGDPASDVRSESRAAAAGNLLADFDILALTPQLFDFNPIIMGEGQGLLAATVTANQRLRGIFFWREV